MAISFWIFYITFDDQRSNVGRVLNKETLSYVALLRNGNERKFST